MKRFTLLILVTLLLCYVIPVLAQDTTPTAEPVIITGTSTLLDGAGAIIVQDTQANNPALIAVIVVLALMVIFLLGAVTYLAQKGFNALPSWARDLVLDNRGKIEAAVDTGTGLLVTGAGLTPNKVDDELAAFIRDELRKAVKEVLDSAPAPAAPAQVVVQTGDQPTSTGG